MLSGSVFEGGEGAGSQGLPDFSPYGLSKALTAQVFRYYCDPRGLGPGQVRHPQPVRSLRGAPVHRLPDEELAGRGEPPRAPAPPTSATTSTSPCLAKAYARFARDLPNAPGFTRINPSGYAESQGAFTLRLAQEMRPRLDLPCAVELKKQTDFSEPRVRINTDILDADALGWNESAAWDDMAAYYQKLHAK